jgi:hypothetical protein
LRASQERRQVAARIAIVTRHQGADAPELAPLRARLDELRAVDLVAAAAAAQAAVFTRAEAVNAGREARRVVQAMTAAESLPGAAGEVA